MVKYLVIVIVFLCSLLEVTGQDVTRPIPVLPRTGDTIIAPSKIPFSWYAQNQYNTQDNIFNINIYKVNGITQSFNGLMESNQPYYTETQIIETYYLLDPEINSFEEGWYIYTITSTRKTMTEESKTNVSLPSEVRCFYYINNTKPNCIINFIQNAINKVYAVDYSRPITLDLSNIWEETSESKVALNVTINNNKKAFEKYLYRQNGNREILILSEMLPNDIIRSNQIIKLEISNPKHNKTYVASLYEK